MKILLATALSFVAGWLAKPVMLVLIRKFWEEEPAREEKWEMKYVSPEREWNVRKKTQIDD